MEVGIVFVMRRQKDLFNEACKIRVFFYYWEVESSTAVNISSSVGTYFIYFESFPFSHSAIRQELSKANTA